MRPVSLIIVHARQLISVPPPPGGGPKTGDSLNDLGIIEDGALAVDGERIVAVGTTVEITRDFTVHENGVRIDATDGVALPGFVDPHTHVLFTGTREWEFEERLRGRTYLEIGAAGGGIRSSTRMFRAASDAKLLDDSLARLDRLAAYGTTTVEVKTGYGLDSDQELRALRLIGELDRRHALTVVATFLGAHDVPDEYRGRPDDYVDLLCSQMIPAAGRTNIPRFCDVFCERGVFDLAQSRRILEAGKQAGMRPKLHADEIEPMGGAELAAEVGAVSADHLARISEAGIEALARAGVVAVLLPATLFSLGARAYAPARRMIAAGVPVALATDCNPGSSMTDSMPWVIALACLQMGLTPAEAITAATYNAAAALDLAGDRGSLTVGRRADIQILDAPSYARLPYHVGSSDLRELIVGGRVQAVSPPPPLRLR